MKQDQKKRVALFSRLGLRDIYKQFSDEYRLFLGTWPRVEDPSSEKLDISFGYPEVGRQRREKGVPVEYGRVWMLSRKYFPHRPLPRYLTLLEHPSDHQMEDGDIQPQIFPRSSTQKPRDGVAVMFQEACICYSLMQPDYWAERRSRVVCFGWPILCPPGP